jgi:hypothetical protein
MQGVGLIGGATSIGKSRQDEWKLGQQLKGRPCCDNPLNKEEEASATNNL